MFVRTLEKRRHWIKKLGITFSFFLILSITAQAANDDKSAVDPYKDGGLSVGSCIVKGNLNFIGFLKSATFSDGILDGMIEPLNDVIKRNQCQSSDILMLIKQRDKVRKQIRNAFFTCSSQKVPTLKRSFASVNAEIYYARHVVDGAIVISLPYELLSTRMLENEDSLYTPKAKLYQDMFDRYVDNGDLTQSEFDLLFNKLETKYKTKKKKYVICDGGAWDQVSAKFKEFVETAGGITPAWKDLSRGVKGSAMRVAKTATETSFKNWITGIVAVNLNNEALRPGFKSILENAARYVPSGGTPTISSVLEAVTKESRSHNVDNIRSAISGNFETLYKGASDEATQSFVTAVDNLNTAIIEAQGPLDKLRGCSSTINDRQCP